MKEVIGCTQSDCCCESFQPRQHQIRSCDSCTHGWVTHAVGKVCSQTVCSGQVEIVHSNVVFDISSLILYGTQALPVRMKILLDRLFSVLTHTQVLNIIHTLGWTLRDYIRGYMLQDSAGKVLDRWVTMSPEEELVTLQQFLRFGETKFIVELMVDQERVPSEGSSDIFSSDLQLRASFSRKDEPVGKDAFLHSFSCISPSATSLFPEHHPARPNKQRHGADEMMPPSRRTPEQTFERPVQPNSQTVKHSTRPPKHLHEKHQSGDVNATVPDSSPSAGTRERPHRFLRKGRVSCSACTKTFYDKGTLKIHFNAVHLKIKHRCTVEGCSMMFSSLRSRNRHSANPNPRLHTSQHATRFSNPQLPTQCCSAGRRFKPFVTQPIMNISQPVQPFHRTTSNTDQHRCVYSGHNDCGSGEWAARSLTANENGCSDVINKLHKRNPRKSSTPLKFMRENHHDNCSEDDDKSVSDTQRIHNLVTLSPCKQL